MQSGEQEKSHAAFSLVSDHSSVVPGGTLTLGLRFRIESGWHIYWNGVNDTGMAPRWTLQLPAGWTSGQAQWPAPMRHVSEGEVLDHVYEGDVMILVPVRVPESAQPGEVTIAVRCDWLVCKEACVFESGEGATKIHVAANGAPASRETEELFRHTRSRLPRVIQRSDEVRIEEEESRITIVAPRASRMRFFPSSTQPRLPDLINEGDVRGERLVLSVQRTGADKSLEGVLEVVREGVAVFFLVRENASASSNPRHHDALIDGGQ